MLSKEECEQVLMSICFSNSRIEDRKVFKDLKKEMNTLSLLKNTEN